MSSSSANEDLRHRRPNDLKAQGEDGKGDINEAQTPQSDDDEDVDKVEQRLVFALTSFLVCLICFKKFVSRLDKIKELLPQGSDSMGSYVDSTLSGLPPRFVFNLSISKQLLLGGEIGLFVVSLPFL